MILNPVVVDMDVEFNEAIDMDIGTAIHIVDPTLQEKSAIPTEQEQIIEADAGFDGLSQVLVAPIPTNYGLITRIGNIIQVS